MHATHASCFVMPGKESCIRDVTSTIGTAPPHLLIMKLIKLLILKRMFPLLMRRFCTLQTFLQ